MLNEFVKFFLRRVTEDNSAHVAEIDVLYQDAITAKQTPVATVVTCSDSRVQKAAFDKETSNDLFIVRNIGNQIMTCEGSVEYGVLCLKTPILLIVGHPQCGAVRACIDGFTSAPNHVQEELRNMDLDHIHTINAGVLHNIHHQVEVACKKFEKLVQSGELTILGAIYDFRNDFKRGHGRFILIDINGEKDIVKIETMLKDDPMLEHLAIGSRV